ncbi:unnamed protein product [Rotaria magnacalcarata]|uniref:Uncharacterized protein n=1 Tax=Rotaria magnacalcarata TaxID=392030 RepID=A0A815DQW0_9BILA|nr:unnamed protein product [Rotaria magnacalcarata]CAF1673296.1 unnamed protein product [Rotaria magnacalcarata]CAF2038048.1 unnamed protein product [Rotaria magnacalcarata]CAF2109265.1 unnamed protein product [Rotaria magnacalcarata]CAF4373243.1 unnamed protein product [Rotaria magnacalcarata]
MATTSNHLAPALEVKELTKKQQTEIFSQQQCYPQSADAQTLAIMKYWIFGMRNVVTTYGATYGPIAALCQAQILTRTLIACTRIQGPLTMAAVTRLQYALNMDPCSYSVMTMMMPMQAAQLSQMYIGTYASILCMNW